MKKYILLITIVGGIVLGLISNSFATCSSCPSPGSPGGDHADETFAVDSGFRPYKPTFSSDPDSVLLTNGFSDEFNNILNYLKKSVANSDVSSSAGDLLSSSNSLIIPSGGLYGMENSEFFKATLDEYVKQGGTLIVFAQQRGYEYNILPTPDGSPITGYGWSEDQACFTNGVYIDTWHQMLAGQTRPTPTANVDGYFTGIPAGSTVLLRRSVNGQPAMIMYPHGNGRVIVTTMYSDWAFAHGQASFEEKNLVNDMISWAKNPDGMPSISPGETANVNVEINNLTETDAAEVKIYIIRPDRVVTLQEQVINQSVAAGQSIVLPIEYTAETDPILPNYGIYHIDYELYDTAGNILQPKAENNRGAFALTNPPARLVPDKEFYLTVSSPSQVVMFGSTFYYTFHVFNNTSTARNLKVEGLLPHTSRKKVWNITAEANSETTINGSDVFIDDHWMYESMQASLYDEKDNQIDFNRLSFKGILPSVKVSAFTTYSSYKKSDTIDLSLSLTDVSDRNESYDSVTYVTVTDPKNTLAYSTTVNKILTPGNTTIEPMSFSLPVSATGGYYTVLVETVDNAGNKVGGNATVFEVLLSEVSTEPVLSDYLVAGTNPVSFNLTNNGRKDVATGNLHVSLKDPEGIEVYSENFPFTLNIGESVSLDSNIVLPPLKVGDYLLTLNQSDETRASRISSHTLSNAITVNAAFAKTAFRIREVADVTFDLTNTGRFKENSVQVEVVVPDAAYSSQETVTLLNGLSGTLSKSISLPESMTAGMHPVIVTLKQSEGSTLSQTFNLAVSKAFLEVDTSEANYTAGDIIGTELLKNTGGQDAEVDYRLRLYDSKSTMIAEKVVTFTVFAGEEADSAFTIPVGAAEGIYDLEVYFKDLSSLQAGTFHKKINVTGARATLDVHTEKDIYLLSEETSAVHNIVNGGTALNNANLHLKVRTGSDTIGKKTWADQYNFQNGIRNGVDTFSQPGSIRLIELSDNFDDQFLNTDRWSLVTTGSSITEVNNVLSFKTLVDSPETKYGYRFASARYKDVWIEGDFDVQVDFSVPNPQPVLGGQYIMDLRFDEGPVSYIQTRYYDRSGRVYYFLIHYRDGSEFYGHSVATQDYSGKFRMKRIGSTITSYYWNNQLQRWEWNGDVNGLSYETSAYPVKAGLENWTLAFAENDTEVIWDNFNVLTQKYAKKGTISLKYDAGKSVPWNKISWIGEKPEGTSIKVRTRTAEVEADLETATWSEYSDMSGSSINSPRGQWIEVEALLETVDANITPVLNGLTVSWGNETGEVIWEEDVPINLAQGAISEASHLVGTLEDAGKYYIEGVLTSNTGQVIAESENEFYLVDGDVVMLLGADKKVYKPGEIVTISGEIKNLSTADLTGLDLNIASTEGVLLTDAVNIAAGGSHFFNLITTAGADGISKLNGSVSQSGNNLAVMSIQYDIASPVVAINLSAPQLTGSTPFGVNTELSNSGRTDAEVQYSLRNDKNEIIDNRAITIHAGEKIHFGYEQTITENRTYIAQLSGDSTANGSASVVYGEAAGIEITLSGVVAEGSVSTPVTISNTGQVDETITVEYHLSPSGLIESRSYYLPVGASTTDKLNYQLTAGQYNLTATSIQPNTASQLEINVVTINDVAMTLSHVNDTASIVNLSADLTNNGWNPIEGTIKFELKNAVGGIAWQGETEVSSLISQSSGNYPVYLNNESIEAGIYQVTGRLINTAGIEIASATDEISIEKENIELTSLPGYETFIPGSEGIFNFTVSNTGGKEGEMSLSLKALDIIDSSRKGWLKAGEQKEISFALLMPDDLEEKDYFADYELKNGSGETIEKGQIKFHVAGIHIGVNASLDKVNYRNGETANLTLDVSNLAPEMQGVNLFARVNYAGYEEQKPFVLNGSETLTFNVPLPEITGEKLFYGIYHGEGRSIHLNTLYIYKAGDVLTVMTDKQVYNPGESIVATVTGEVPGLSGSMTLTGPNDFVETFDFSDSATRNITLPAVMKAGTYHINAQLDSASSGTIAANHPVDVNGIQVKVTEATLDKARYNATDTMNLDLKVESNTDIATELKTWVIYPTGNNDQVGAEPLALSSTEPVSVNHSAPLTTEHLGIHRLVYGIYVGDLLLASGSEAFDVGNAVLNSVGTDKPEYANVGEPVTVSLNMYGTVPADVELYIDGLLVKTEAVELNGYLTKTTVLDDGSVTPGNHTLKAVLLSGGLKSEKETTFKYGTSLPDLVVQLETSDSNSTASKELQATITNQGKTASTASSVSIYDGTPEEGALIVQIPINPLAPSESTTVSHNWSLLGKAGSHTLYAVVDPDNSVSEFIEYNNSSITSLYIREIDMKVSTSAQSYEANSAVGIIKDVVNFTTYTSYSNVTLQRKVNGPAGEVDSSTELISSLAPGEISYVDSWNTASNMPGLYDVEATLSVPVIVNGQVAGESLLALDTTTFEVLPTLSVSGTMALSANEVIQGFPLDINYSLNNNGNIDITGGELSASVTNLADSSSTVIGSSPIETLAVLENYSGLMAMESVNVEPGDYEVSLDLTSDGKLIEIAKAGLVVKPPLKVEKLISTLPRVLVWTPLTKDKQATTNEIMASTALSEMGAYYRIVHTEADFKEAMRSGYFNFLMLLDSGKPTTDGLTAELAERVRGGSSLVLVGRSGMDDFKVKDVTGVKFTGYNNIKGLVTASIGQPLYEVPLNLTVSGKMEKLELISNHVEVAATVENKGKLYPSVTVNSYGKGMAANFSFDLGISADATGNLTSYIALLKDVVTYGNPEPDAVVAGTVLPIEIKVESFGAAFDLKIKEEAGLLTVLDANMNGLIDTTTNSITWNSHLPVNGINRFMYLAALPDSAGIYNTATEIYYLKNGEEKLYGNYVLDADVPEGTAQLETNIVVSIGALSVSPAETTLRDDALDRFEAMIVAPNSTRKDMDKRIHELLKVIADLEKLSVDTTAIIEKLDDLLVIYERKWVSVK